MSSVDFSMFSDPNFMAQLASSDPQNPDYGALLANDPTLHAALLAIDQQQAADRAALVASDRGQIVNYGAVPDFTQIQTAVPNWDQSIWGDVTDPTTTGLAGQATASGVSTLAQNQHAADVARANMMGGLAARGALNSGALLTHSNEGNLAANITRFNALNSLLGALNTNYGGYLTNLGQRTTDRNTAVNDALQRIIAQIQANQLANKIPPQGLPTSQTPIPGSPSMPGGIPNPQGSTTVPVIEPGDQIIQEPKGLGSVPDPYGDSLRPPDAPNPYDMVGQSSGASASTAAPTTPSNYLQTIGSDAGGSNRPDVNVPVVTAPPVPKIPAAPKPIGYGGGSTSFQVSRNK